MKTVIDFYINMSRIGELDIRSQRSLVTFKKKLNTSHLIEFVLSSYFLHDLNSSFTFKFQHFGHCHGFNVI